MLIEGGFDVDQIRRMAVVNPSALGAHAADYVWRAGGTIALYASRGYKVRILCLSFWRAWGKPGSLEATRHDNRAG
jgi:LmbE family N-acetylglucosaminyl deacetylase